MNMEEEIQKEYENNREIQFTFNKDELFRGYYARCFPYEKIYKWLSYSKGTEKGEPSNLGKDYFNKREISYMIVSKMGEEVCLRHLCYNSLDKFKNDIISKNPIRVDVGAVYNTKPSDAKNVGNEKPETEEREYVIDIDMTDYDLIRTCCSGKSICESCWKYIKAAYLVLKEALEQDFGFTKILWIFSGRRGIHAWVCDRRARQFRNYERATLTHYLDIAINNEKMDSLVKPSVHKNPEYKLIRRSYDILAPMFDNFMIEEQAFLVYPKNIQLILDIMKRHLLSEKSGNTNLFQEHSNEYENLSKKLKKRVLSLQGFDSTKKRKYPTEEQKKDEKFMAQRQTEAELSKELYALIMKFYDTNGLDAAKEKFLREIVIGLMYPKLDAHVSAQTNHLLKCPFNIHSSTGLVSVPVPNFDTFKLSDVPFVQEIVQAQADGTTHPKFAEYLKVFDEFLDEKTWNAIDFVEFDQEYEKQLAEAAMQEETI